MSAIITLPNLITSLRIVGTIVLLFLEPFTKEFYVIYAFTGITDALDGLVARATHTTSEFGSKLDSIADIIFYLVMFDMITPTLWELLPRYIWLFVAVVVVLRIYNYAKVAFTEKRLASPHTILNKVTGGLIFLLPFIIKTKILTVYGWLLIFVSFVSIVTEMSIKQI